MANHKKAPVGSSHKTGMGKSPKQPNLSKILSGGKSVPTVNAERTDKFKQHSGAGGVKK